MTACWIQSNLRPAPEYQLRVAGETAELQVKEVRGLPIFAGYLGDPAATAEAFTQDGYFRTGDLVTLRADAR